MGETEFSNESLLEASLLGHENEVEQVFFRSPMGYGTNLALCS